MNLTKRNHYNPCFWTALWNQDYFRNAQIGEAKAAAREQVVHVLNIKSKKVLQTTVERVHYDKNLGIAEITKEAAERFTRRYHPDQLQRFLEESKTATYPVFIDFEALLSALEGMPPYKVLIKVALAQNIDTLIEKTNLAAFVALQCLRSHAIMNSMIDWHEELGDSKFEHFVTLKWMLSDPHYLHRLVYPLLCSQWNLFTCADHMLPLGDSPILVSSASTMVALSPRLLLEIHPAVRTKEDSLPLIQRINSEKFNEYRRRTIGNTFREIIGEQDVLDQLRVSSEFQARASLMKDVKKYNTMVVADGEREVWHLNAYGNANPSASSRGPEDA